MLLPQLVVDLESEDEKQNQARANQTNNVRITHGIDNVADNLVLHLLCQAPQQIAGGVRDYGADFFDGEVRQQRPDSELGFVDEDGLRDAETDGRPAQLRKGLPPDTVADISGDDLCGRCQRGRPSWRPRRM